MWKMYLDVAYFRSWDANSTYIEKKMTGLIKFLFGYFLVDWTNIWLTRQKILINVSNNKSNKFACPYPQTRVWSGQSFLFFSIQNEGQLLRFWRLYKNSLQQFLL